jgi:hypothetical protein
MKMSRRYKEEHKPNASSVQRGRCEELRRRCRALRLVHRARGLVVLVLTLVIVVLERQRAGGCWATTLEDTRAAPAGLAAKTAHEVRAALAPALLLRAGRLPGRRRVAAWRRRLWLDRYHGWRWRAGVVWRRPAHSHDHATLVTDSLHPLRRTPVCFSVSLYLSRARLGKSIVCKIFQ